MAGAKQRVYRNENSFSRISIHAAARRSPQLLVTLLKATLAQVQAR
jgi:hypothetical protein